MKISEQWIGDVVHPNNGDLIMRYPVSSIVVAVVLATNLCVMAEQSAPTTESKVHTQITKLVHDCESDDPGTRWRAAALLSTYSPAAIPILTDALASPAADVRWCACVALARMAPNAPATLKKLKTVMAKDADPAVRQVAQLAAHRIGGKEVALEPATVALAPLAEPGGFSFSVQPVHLFEMLGRQIETAKGESR